MIEDEVWEWHDAAIARRRREYLSEIRAGLQAAKRKTDPSPNGPG
jgi:hypothetical protein